MTTNLKPKTSLAVSALVAALLYCTGSSRVFAFICSPPTYSCPDQRDKGPCPNGSDTCPADCPPGRNTPPGTPPSPGGPGGPPPGGPAPKSPNGGCSSCGPNSNDGPTGMPQYWVSEPWINLHIEDTPLSYSPSYGSPISFRVSYRQRDAAGQEAEFFGVGPSWFCSFRTHIEDLTSQTSGLFRLHRPGAGAVDYMLGTSSTEDGSVLAQPTPGVNSYRLTYKDGTIETFSTSFTGSSQPNSFLTSRSNANGVAVQYRYLVDSTHIQLTNIVDADGLITKLYYTNTDWPNQISMVVDPYNRTNALVYDGVGRLATIIDVAGLPTSFTYQSTPNQYWVQDMTTLYGVTTFVYGGDGSNLFNENSNAVNRYIEVTLPTGGKELYLYRQDCTGLVPTSYSPLPVTTGITNTFDNVADKHLRNSLYWGPLQYSHLSTTNPASLTSTDYKKGRLRHWLFSTVYSQMDCLSLERIPSPDGTTDGQITWYDYLGKSSPYNGVGTGPLPSFIATVLPNGDTWFKYFTRNGLTKLLSETSTYTQADGSTGRRVRSFQYDSNNIDLVKEIGPNNEVVVSNYYGNPYHQPSASHDALGQTNSYTYNAARQLTSMTSVTGLVTTNSYDQHGWKTNSLEYELVGASMLYYRSNAFTYQNGLVKTFTDERGLTTTYFWDNLQRLTGITYPGASVTSISNSYSKLDLVATKDRLGYWTYFGYNQVRQKVAETNAVGTITLYDYCTCGALQSVTKAWGTPVQQIITYVLDNLGNRKTNSFPDLTVKNTYDSLGRLLTTDDGTSLRTFVYNNQGLVTNIHNTLGNEQVTVYDNEDWETSVTDANGVTVSKTYDLLGRLSSNTYPDTGAEKNEPHTPTKATSVPTENELALGQLLSYELFIQTKQSLPTHTEHPNALPTSWRCPG